MTNQIPFNKPSYSSQDLDFLSQSIGNGHTSGNGPFAHLCEELIALRLNAARALLTTSCTHALELSARLLNLGSGDEVLVPSFTFVSTASAFAICGAKPVFVDVRPDTLNIDESLVEACITSRTRAICVVHYAGVACEMRPLLEIAAHYKLPVVEDNAHGFMGRAQGRLLGTFGSLATLSFHETKNITCGEGGSLTINDESLVERAEVLRDKGTNRSRYLRGQVDKYTWTDVGSSWVQSDLLAAILWGQLQRVDAINERRIDLWNRYFEALSEWALRRGVILPVVPEGSKHVGHLFHIRLRDLEQRTRFIQHMSSRSISCVFHYQALNSSPVGMTYGGYLGQCPVAESASDCLVRLPLFFDLSDDDQMRVIDSVLAFRP